MSNEIMTDVVEMEKKAEQEMAPVMQRARAFLVIDEVSYLAADQIASEIKAKVKEREAELLPPKDAATKAWKAMCALVKKYIDDPLEAVKMLDRKRYAWKKGEEQKRLDAAEAKRKVKEKEAAEERLRLAERLEAQGMEKLATTVLNAPIAPVVIIEPEKIMKVEGQVNIENWQARIIDADAVPREFCSPDSTKLSRYAKIMKEKAAVAGVVFEDVGTTRRRA